MRILEFIPSSGRVAFIAPPVAAKRRLFCMLYEAIVRWFDPESDYRFIGELFENDPNAIATLKDNAPDYYYLLETFLLNINRVDRPEPIAIDSLTNADLIKLLALCRQAIEVEKIPQIRYPDIPKSKDDAPIDFNKYLESSGCEEIDLLADLWAYGLGEKAIDLYCQFDLETILRINYRVRQVNYLQMPELREHWKNEEINSKARSELDKFLGMIERGEITDSNFGDFKDATS